MFTSVKKRKITWTMRFGFFNVIIPSTIRSPQPSTWHTAVTLIIESVVKAFSYSEYFTWIGISLTKKKMKSNRRFSSFTDDRYSLTKPNNLILKNILVTAAIAIHALEDCTVLSWPHLLQFAYTTFFSFVYNFNMIKPLVFHVKNEMACVEMCIPC